MNSSPKTFDGIFRVAQKSDTYSNSVVLPQSLKFDQEIKRLENINQAPNLLIKIDPTENQVTILPARLITQSQMFETYSMFGFVNVALKEERWHNYHPNIWKKINNLTKNRLQEGSVMINNSVFDKFIFAYQNLSKSNVVLVAILIFVIVGFSFLAVNQYKYNSTTNKQYLEIQRK